MPRLPSWPVRSLTPPGAAVYRSALLPCRVIVDLQAAVGGASDFSRAAVRLRDRSSRAREQRTGAGTAETPAEGPALVAGRLELELQEDLRMLEEQWVALAQRVAAAMELCNTMDPVSALRNNTLRVISVELYFLLLT